MPDLLADLDVFVLASTNPEPFSTVLAEALACGVPVAAADNGGTPEMLADVPPDSGVLVIPGDALALADAVTRLVPTGPSSVSQRRGRRPMRLKEPVTFDELFGQALLFRAGR
jgi:glycosyltransferase involved in cell wall biosynthesis